MTPWHGAVDNLSEWLENEADERIAFQRHMKRIVGVLLAATTIMGAALTIAIFVLTHQVDLNRRVLQGVCDSQGHTITYQSQSLKESVPLFRHLIPADKLATAVGRSRHQIAVLARDRRRLGCARLERL